MEKQIRQILSQSLQKIADCQNKQELEKAYIELFGRNGIFTALTKQLATFSSVQKPKLGQLVNKAKNKVEQSFQKKQALLREKRATQYIDVTAPGKKLDIGHLHLVSQAMEEIVSIFKELGFSLASHPEVEWDWYAFEALNMPKNHPARDDWETFFVKAKPQTHFGRQVLTPHTSNGQIREMEKVKSPPIRMLNIARCYRRQIDVSHTPMFHQFEGLLVDENVSIADLKGTFDYFTTKFFGPQRLTRLRQYHFRFTEPSFEVDIVCGVCLGRGCRFCKSGWVELGGAGMVHPKVLKAGGIDFEKYTGFAFGWGIERTIAMRTNLNDIRLLYQNDLRFLEQF